MATKDTINVTGHVLVSDILTALEPMVTEGVLSVLDKELESRSDERVSFDDTDVLVEDAIDGLDDADKLPEPESLTYLLDESDVIGIAEAIRCGETEQAELLLDRIFAAVPGASEFREWIDRGRFSKKAREAKTAARSKLELRSAA